MTRWRIRHAGRHRGPVRGRTPHWRFTARFVALLALLLSVTGCTPRRAEISSQESRFLWHQANAQIASADTADDFAAAARTYQRLEAGGVSNGPLLYNLGVALLMSDAPDAALTALLRAERYLGATPDLRANLELAWQRQKNAERAWPWTRTVFALHYRLPLQLRENVLWIAYQLLWLGLLAYALRRPALGRPVVISAAVLLAVMATSVGTTHHQEAASRRQAAEIAARVEGGSQP